MSTLYTVDISTAIMCAMNLDDREMRRELGLDSNGIKNTKRGCKITGSLEDIERLAYHMTRESGWDLAPSTIAACNKRAMQLRAFVAGKRAVKDMPLPQTRTPQEDA